MYGRQAQTSEDHYTANFANTFFKRAPAILAKYEATMRSLQANDDDTDLLIVTHFLLEVIWDILQNERPPLGLTDLIQMIGNMSLGWPDHLKAVGDEDILTRWDNLICKSGLTFHIYETVSCSSSLTLLDADQNRKLSL
jgi:hypothetical protein